ncbi:MAG: protein-disulfide reductase DsbD family protein [Rhodobacteraceae bacterium]|nr:protein-disulfide reductase DsbD family protein [Paracoccaceae bacterium]
MKPAAASALLVAAALAAAPLGAARAADLPDPIARAELIGGWTTPSGTRMAALRLTLASGWKTYWRAPGDAGIPPAFDWTGSGNLRSVAFHWPRPEVIDVGGMRTLGYHGELVLPIELTPIVPDAPVDARATVQLGVCDEVCVPLSLSVRAELPKGLPADAAVKAALADQPERLDAPVRCAVEPLRDGLRLTATASLPSPGADEFAVIEVADGGVWVSPADSRRTGPTLVSVADLVPADARPFALDRSQVRITVFGGGRAVEIEGCTG